MKHLLLFLFAIVTMATPSMAEDLDSLYASTMLPEGTPVPEMTIDSTKNITLSSLRGRYVVLHFWASWCGDCRKDMPAMNELANTYANDSIVFVHISYDTNKEAWQKYIAGNNMTGIHTSELKKMRETETYKLFNIKWIPALYLISPEGRVMLRTVQVEKLAESLKHLPISK